MNDYLPRVPIDILKLRAALLKKLRGFFDERDFVEVTTPVLSTDTVVDEHLDPLSAIVFADPSQPDLGTRKYLQTSPEFHMKRLLSAGMEKIFQIGPAFRGAESGQLHNTEFTMVEWYRVGDDMQAGIALLAEVAATLFDLDAADPASIDRCSYSAAFEQSLNAHPLESSYEQLCTLAGALREVGKSDSRDDLLNLLWSHHVEPALGKERPVVIYDYPASQAALAKTRGEVAERFELYARGVELANGYHELTDAAELRRRNQHLNDLRAASGKRRLREDSRLLEAMQVGLPACAGVALGFDRAVMVAAGKSRLDEVMPFPDANA